MENYTENSLLDMIYDENQNLKSVLLEIKNFNENFSFIETFADNISMKINDIILLEEGDEDYFNEEREYLAERILRLDDALMEMGLATYEYRGEEFYGNGEINAFGCKIGIKISDIEIFEEFISTQKSSNIDELYEFIYSCILDSQNRENFRNIQPESNENNLDIIGNLQQMGEISHSGLRELVQNYHNGSLHQSLLSKFYITKFREFFQPKSIEFIGDFQELEKVRKEGLGAFESIMSSNSPDGNYKKSALELGTFLDMSLDYTYQLIIQELLQLTNRISNPKTSKETIKFKNLEYLHFVQKFYHLYDKRKLFLKKNMDL